MGQTESTDTSINAFGRGANALPPATRVGTTNPLAQAQVMQGYLNREASAQSDSIAVGIVNQRAQSNELGSLGAWPDMGCMNRTSEEGCPSPGYGEAFLVPVCCHPDGKLVDDDKGWWLNDDDMKNNNRSGPCWRIRGAYQEGLETCTSGAVTLGHYCKTSSFCTNCDQSLCPTLAGVKPQPALTDFLWTSPDVTVGASGQPVTYQQGASWSNNFSIDFKAGFSQIGCVYDRAELLASLDALKAFRTAFGAGTNTCDPALRDDWFSLMLDYSLATSVGDCLYGGAGKRCARLHQRGPEGDFCREWWSGLDKTCQVSLRAAAQTPIDRAHAI